MVLVVVEVVVVVVVVVAQEYEWIDEYWAFSRIVLSSTVSNVFLLFSSVGLFLANKLTNKQ